MVHLFDATHTTPIHHAAMPSDAEFTERYIAQREPVVLDQLEEHLPYVGQWSERYFTDALKTIRVHRPDASGVYHFIGFQRIPIADFLQDREREKSMYSLEPLFGDGAPQGSRQDRHRDFDERELPGFIPRDKMRVSNLYMGPGDNKSLLHFDEMHSLLIMVSGEKRFALFRPNQTANVYPYSAFDIRAILQHRVLDSRINPVDLDTTRFPRIRRAQGLEGRLRPGQALFIPAGTWHYIESDAPNTAVNYFWHQSPLKHRLQRPLLDFWFKRRQVLMIDAARKVRDTVRARIGQPG